MHLGLPRLCGVIGALSLLNVIGGSDLPAQPTQTSRATLIVRTPSGLLPSSEYWLYIDGRIVSAPPRAAFPTLAREFMRTSGSATEEFWDAAGQAAVSRDGVFTHLRAGLRERVFETHPPIQVPARRLVVELVTRAVNSGFPFAVARIEVTPGAGETREIEFGIPLGTSEERIARAIGRPRSFITEENLKYAQADFDRTVAEFDNLPMVAVLNEAILNAPDPPATSVFAALPQASGGGRDLDARQIALIIDALVSEYSVTPIGRRTEFANAADSVQQLAAVLDLKIAAHNKRITDFRQILNMLVRR